MVNRVYLLGRITRDIETKQIGEGMLVAKSAIAVNRKFKKKDGEVVEKSIFIDFAVFGKQAENLAQYAKKGSLVHIEGRLEFEQWQDQEGNKRSKHSIVAERITYLDCGGNKKEETGESSDDERNDSAPQQAETGEDSGPTAVDISDDDLPF